MEESWLNGVFCWMQVLPKRNLTALTPDQGEFLAILDNKIKLFHWLV